MPFPRTLSSNCEVSARIYYDGQVDKLINEQIEEIFENHNGNYSLIFDSEN